MDRSEAIKLAEAEGMARAQREAADARQESRVVVARIVGYPILAAVVGLVMFMVWEYGTEPTPAPRLPIVPRSTESIAAEIATLEAERAQLAEDRTVWSKALTRAKQIRTSARVSAIAEAESALEINDTRINEIDRSLAALRGE